MRTALFNFVTWFFRKLSPAALARLGKFVGFVLWHVMRDRRQYAIQAISEHLPVGLEEARRIARASFAENSRSFLEIFHTGIFGFDSPLVVVDTPEVLAAANAEPGPCLFATAHFGAWEIMAALSAEMRPGFEKIVVVRSYRSPFLTESMFKLRGARGTRIIGHRNASVEVSASLKRNGMVAFLVDHNAGHTEAIFLPFLGEVAAVNAGPALLALRAKAVVYPAFLLRDEEGRYHFQLKEPLRTADLSGSISERVEQIATFYTKAVEDMVKAHPEQWFWMHQRWKTRPRKNKKSRMAQQP